MTREEFEERMQIQTTVNVYRDLTSEDWAQGLSRLVPQHIQHSIVRWVALGQPAQHGQFVAALLSNDLIQAVTRADETNLAALADICRFLYNYAPSHCFGSTTAYHNWTGMLD